MPFINEYTSAADAEKYGLAEIDKKIVGGNRSRQWTIDRDRDIYLRNVSRGHHETSHESLWTFYWKGAPLTLRLDLLEAGGKPGGAAWSHWELVFVNGSNGLPAALNDHGQEFLEDLKEALLAYKDLGVLSQSIYFEVALDVAEECVL